jgi:hypothetical protein
MKIKTSTIVGLAALGIVVAAVLLANKKGRKNRLTQIADEGYETAHDMLYPNSFKGAEELRYGPVLPN